MKILLATDGSNASRDAEWFLSRVAFGEPVDLTLLNVAHVPFLGTMRREYPSSVEAILEECDARGRELLTGEAAAFEGINGTVRTELLHGHAADAILEFAEENRPDLLVIGARGQSPVQRFLLGSVSQKVALHAPGSVLVTRPTGIQDARGRPLRILVCHDGSESAQAAVAAMARISWGENVEFIVLGVLGGVPYYGMDAVQATSPVWEQEKQSIEEALASAVTQLQAATPHVRSELREAPSAAAGILDAVEQTRADLVVVGDRGRSRIQRFFLGSTSDLVLRHAPCSVWIVRPA